MTPQYPYSFPLEAITCARGRGTDRGYDAELRFDNKHYVISSGHPTREDALLSGTKAQEELLNILRAAAKSFTSRYKEAQP